MKVPSCISALSRRAFNELDPAAQASFKGRIIESSHARVARYDDPERRARLAALTSQYNQIYK